MQYMWKREAEILAYMYGQKSFSESRTIQVPLCFSSPDLCSGFSPLATISLVLLYLCG
jgi:hypothetical protein